MRLIDADALIKRFEGLRDEHETHSISYNALYEVLVQQPTAYDVDAVVKELEDSVVCGMFGARFGKSDTEIIDIIRKGGVKNDN